MTQLTFVAFCVQVLALAMTPAWRVLLSVAIDGVQPRDLMGDARQVARELFGDVDEIDPRVARVQIWRLGRGSGKSTFAAALALFCALTADLSRAGPGQVPVAFVVSPSKPVARIVLGIARELLRLAGLDALVIDDTAEGFTIRRLDGRVVEIRSVAASKGGVNLRGRDVIVLVLDESEFFASNAETTQDGYAVTDVEQVQAVKPRLLPHGFVLLISTPWPTVNHTDELFSKNHGAPRTALAALGTSMFMRPSPELAEDIARELESDPETADREYNCKSGTRGGSRFFDPAAVDACVDAARALATVAPVGALLGCGGDLALEKDSSAIAIVSLAKGRYELLEFDEVRPGKGAPLRPEYVIRSRFAPLMKRHRVRAIMLDAHYRQSAIEHLDAMKLGFVDAPTGAQGKYDSYMATRSAIHGGLLRIPSSPRLVSQLKSIVAVPLPGGFTKITAPRRAGQGHADIVSALVCAIASLPSYDQRRERASKIARLGAMNDHLTRHGWDGEDAAKEAVARDRSNAHASTRAERLRQIIESGVRVAPDVPFVEETTETGEHGNARHARVNRLFNYLNKL